MSKNKGNIEAPGGLLAGCYAFVVGTSPAFRVGGIPFEEGSHGVVDSHLFQMMGKWDSRQGQSIPRDS